MVSRKGVLALLCILCMAFVIVACGGNNNAANGTKSGTQGDQATNNEAAQNETEEPAADEQRVIEHAMGKTTIEGTPKRIVTLYQGATDVALAMGVTPVGVVESWVQKPVYEYLRDELEGVAQVGLETQPNLEEIDKLDPDLIIASKTRHADIYEQLSAIAPTVTHETVFKFKETTELMGKAMNMEDKAADLLAEWESRVADFTTKAEEKLSDQWPIEVSVLNFRADHARIYVTGYAGDILSELGFVRSEYQQEEADKGTVVVSLTSKETIPSMNGDVFFIFNAATSGDSTEDEAVKKTYEEWTGHPLWGKLDAVTKNQVYMVDEVAWNMAGGMLSAHTMLDQLYEHFGLEK